MKSDGHTAPNAPGRSGNNAVLSPTNLLKRGWNGVTSPIASVKDTVMSGTAMLPRSISSGGAFFGGGGNSSGVSSSSSAHRKTGGSGSSSARTAMPSPAEYPSLFDIRSSPVPLSSDSRQYTAPPTPGSTTSASSATAADGGDALFRSGSSSRISPASNGLPPRHTAGLTLTIDNDDSEDAHAYRAVSHHNLHSVLTTPRSGHWSGLFDALYQNPLDVDLPLPSLSSFPGLAEYTNGSGIEMDAYLKKYGLLAKRYEDNHSLPIHEQLSSSQVPTIEVADEDVATCLRTVPSLFFRPEFDLTNPSTFEQVMDMSVASTSLQEELSGYLDRVEFTLLRQVSSRSDRFFEASTNQGVMKQSIATACDHVATLRKTMDRLRNGLADKSLDIVSLHRRQKRIAELHEVVTMIEGVKTAESAVEALVQCNEYSSALDLIEQAQTTLREHLKGIHGLGALSDKLQGYRSLIATQISQRFISSVTSPEWMFQDDGDDDTNPDSELSTALSHSTRPSRSMSDVSASSDIISSTSEMQRLVGVLFRVDTLSDVVRTYRDRLTEEIKVVVKTVVTETIAVSSSSNEASTRAAVTSGNVGGTAPVVESSKVSIQLRALNSDEFLQCVKMIFEHVLMVLERAVVVQNLLTKSMQRKIRETEETEKREIEEKEAAMEGKSDAGSPALASEADVSGSWTPSQSSSSDEQQALGDWKIKSKCNQVIQDIDDVVRKTCEFSQRSVSNLFAVRKEVQAVYTMPQLRLLYDTTMDFVVNIEKLTNKTDYTLRGALFSQLKLFLEKYHHAQTAKLVSTLDRELWKHSEISVTRHQLLEDLSSGRGVSLTLSEDRDVSGEMAAPFKSISVCGKSFRVVWSVLLMLEIVMNYMSCAANFPVLATDVLQRTIEILRLFNSRTTQLVLGAGAMQIARLKSISARHLALASQSLELTVTLIPHIKAALAAHFTDRQKLLLEEFDRVLRDYAEHNEKIFSKFTSIVEDQIMKRFLENVHAEVDYDAPQLSIPSGPMKGIKDSTLKLHAVLHPVLSTPQMKDVMSRVFDMFSQKLPECFKLVKPTSAAGKQKVVEDVSLFVRSFSEATTVEFDGQALMRHFRTVYDVPADT